MPAQLLKVHNPLVLSRYPTNAVINNNIILLYHTLDASTLILRTTSTAKFVRWLHSHVMTLSSPIIVVHPSVIQSSRVKSQVTHISVPSAMTYN